MSGPLATAAALVVAFAALSLRLVGAANWPLTRYGRCGQREAGLGGFAAPDVSVDEDAGVYWMSYGQFLYRFKLEDNSIVGGFASRAVPSIAEPSSAPSPHSPSPFLSPA